MLAQQLVKYIQNIVSDNTLALLAHAKETDGIFTNRMMVAVS